MTSLACSFSVELNDSYGDGWNGGSLTVYVNGSAVLTNITLSGGSGPALFTFEANTGDEITTSYIAGSWPYENWYEIKDEIGYVIATDGDDTQTITPLGISIPIIAFCPLNLDATISEIITNDYAGEHDVYVTLHNVGIDTIFSSTIGWNIDGISQTSFSWSDTLASNETEQILLGSYIFEPGISYFIKAWSENPNGGTDENILNDTAILDLSISPNMTINSVTSFTNDTSVLFTSAKDNEIFGININTINYSNILSLDSIKLNTTGSDDFLNDITSVKIYSTDSINKYNKTNLIWEGIDISSAIHFDIPLKVGDNFFWVAVDVGEWATNDNDIYVTCEFVTIEGIEYIPMIIEPYLKRTIKEKPKYYNFMPANIVVGQPDFYTQNTSLDEYTGVGSNNSAVSSKGVLAVGSQSEGRILIWNSVPDTNGTPADIVLGSPDFYSINDGPTESYMRNIEGICFSPDGEKLIASDGNNNRVLIWNSIPTTNAQPADVVIGQTDFTSGSSGIGPDKLYYPGGVIVTQDGKLIITELYNNRVLIFNQIPTTNGASADVVVGQEDFYSNSQGVGPNKLNGPWYSAVSNDGKLLIGDERNHRILIYNEFPTTNGASADIVIGQVDFYTNTFGTSDSTFNYPIGVTVSPTGELAIGEFGNNRVLIFNEIPTSNNAKADYVLGQPDFYSNTAFNGGISEKSMRSPYGINFDLNGRLYVNGRDMHRVMIYGDLPEDTADLEITVSANKTNPHIGEDIIYTFTLKNNGPDNSSNVIVKSALPGLFNLESYTAEKGTYQPFGGTWNIPLINPGESIDLVLEGNIEDGAGDITAYSNIIASSAVDNNMVNNAISITIDVINEAPVISVFEKDTIVQGNSTEWIPFTISDADSDMSKLEVTAVSSDQTILNNIFIELNGTTGSRYLKATPFANQSGAVDIMVTVSDGFNEATSMLELYILSNNANLSNLDTTGTTITGFRADSLYYTCELNASVLTAPTVTAIAESDKATVNIFETDSLPGITTVEVIAEDGVTIKTYLVTFIYTVNTDNDASLKDLKLDGNTIEGFSPIKYLYAKYLPYGTAIVPTIEAIPTNELASININQTISLPGKDTIIVTATDGVTEQLYVIEYIVNSASTNNNLKKIVVDGEEIIGFDPDVLDYIIEYPYGTSSVPMVIAIPEDANAFVDQTDPASMPGITTLDVYAQDGSLKTYTVEFTLADPSDDATLSKIKVDGTPIFGFDPSVYSYDVELEPSVSIVPTVDAIAANDSAVITITEAGSLPGTTDIEVTAQDGVTELTYEVNFTYRPLSTISLLSDLKVEGATIQGFDPEIYSYMHKVPVETNSAPVVTATVYDSRATKVIENATSVPGTTTITVTAEDGSTSEYTVYFTFDNLSSDATLNDLTVDGTTVAGFSANTLIYNVELPYGTTTVPSVAGTPTISNAEVNVVDAASLPGTTVITVTAEDDYTQQVYEINFTLAAPSNIATLSDLKVDGTTVSGFNASTLTYNVELSSGTTTVPTVAATATDENADVNITNAASLPGTTTILVTAEDNISTQTYSINFTVATSINDFTNGNSIVLYPNPSNGLVNIVFGNAINTAIEINVYNSIGSIVFTDKLQDLESGKHEIDLTTLPKGMYFIKISADNESTVKNVIIK